MVKVVVNPRDLWALFVNDKNCCKSQSPGFQAVTDFEVTVEIAWPCTLFLNGNCPWRSLISSTEGGDTVLTFLIDGKVNLPVVELVFLCPILLTQRTVLYMRIWAKLWRLYLGLSEKAFNFYFNFMNRKNKKGLMFHCSSHSLPASSLGMYILMIQLKYTSLTPSLGCNRGSSNTGKGQFSNCCFLSLVLPNINRSFLRQTSSCWHVLTTFAV